MSNITDEEKMEEYIQNVLTSDALRDLDDINKTIEQIANIASITMGQGSGDKLLQTAMSRLDRFGTMMIPSNYELSGMTFITRPRLNLSTPSLRMHPVLSSLATDDHRSVAFMIRALMDTRLSHAQGTRETLNVNSEETLFRSKVDKSPLMDARSPWFTPLCNCLTDISGWPDFNVETETTQGGFYSEDMTYAKGGDLLNKTSELSLGFRDITGGIVMAIFYYWLLYMALQSKGEVMAYGDDIYEQRLNYDVAIYRFMFDPSRKVITKWAKATGCFPKSVPIGAAFNVVQGEQYVSSAAKFTIPFVANKVEYMDGNIIKDFNTLATRYWPNISSYAQKTSAPNTPDYNFLGLPYIVSTERGLEMEFVYNDSDHINDFKEKYNEISSLLDPPLVEYTTPTESSL